MRTFFLQTSALLSQAAIIRKWLEKLLSDFEFNKKDINDLKIVISEAFSNIVRHSYEEVENPLNKVDIYLTVDPEKVTISMRDYGKKFKPNGYESPDPNQLSESGYGLFLMNQLTSGMEYITTHPLGTELRFWKNFNHGSISKN